MSDTPVTTVITCHANADFDALAAMIAASKLYPHAALIFPGSQESALRNYFLQSVMYLFQFQNIKDVKEQNITTVVVVDTAQKNRIPHVEHLLENATVHVYDHHLGETNDLYAEKSIILPWGATTSILVHELRDRGITVTADEATILGLGIYEDTGHFTFSSTTEHDFQAAAWLRANGMDLDIIHDILRRDLSAEQLTLLSRLLDSAVTHTINGIEIVVADAESETYMADFALLAHKLMEMENIRVLFALCRMADRVQLVARSKISEVDAGLICRSFGGGGHPYAASASIKDRTLAQVKDELFALLYSSIHHSRLVRHFMSAPAVGIDADQTLQEAASIMTRYGFKALPVTQAQTPVGIIEHAVADKAVAHGLGDERVREYMQDEIRSVAEDEDLYAVMEIILGQRQRLVPVMRAGAMVGVVTRTDLIHLLVQEPARIPESLLPGRRTERSIAHVLRERLAPATVELLETAGRVGHDMGMPAYAVGGFVRDVLLGNPNDDIDLVVEGEGIAFAHALSKQLGGRVRPHPKFHTAVLVLPGGEKIDVATARLEYYEYPAALPVVELSSLKMDLFRRDFSINTLAVHLDPDHFGLLVDFFGGQQDLKDRVIRVLHSLSFVEDPTRILRAVRFEQRFRFTINVQTERLIKNALRHNLFQRLSGGRIFHELVLLLSDAAPVDALLRLRSLGVLQQIHSALHFPTSKEPFLREVERVLTWHGLLYRPERPKAWIVYLLALCSGMESADFARLLQRFGVSQKQHSSLATLRYQVRGALMGLEQGLRRGISRARLAEILESLPLEGLLYAMARSTNHDIKRNISLYLTTLRDMKLLVSGADIAALGLPPGPVYGRILRAVRRGLLNGSWTSREEQLQAVARFARVWGQPHPKTRSLDRSAGIL
jgi:tRNA nucleotidyltransferase (CCA-adding enzyme)